MSPPRQFFPQRPKKKQDSDSMATFTETLLGVIRAVRQNGEQITQLIERQNDLIAWLTLNKMPSRPPAWIPTGKKEITTVMALVVFALTVLAIILASCGVIGCQELTK